VSIYVRTGQFFLVWKSDHQRSQISYVCVTFRSFCYLNICFVIIIINNLTQELLKNICHSVVSLLKINCMFPFRDGSFKGPYIQELKVNSIICHYYSKRANWLQSLSTSMKQWPVGLQMAGLLPICFHHYQLWTEYQKGWRWKNNRKRLMFWIQSLF
jgi:hypothetical protein